MDDKKPVLLTLHEALRLDLIEAYVAREITLAEEGKKSQRSLDNDDMLEALKQLQSRSEDIFGKRVR